MRNKGEIFKMMRLLVKLGREGIKKKKKTHGGKNVHAHDKNNPIGNTHPDTSS